MKHFIVLLNCIILYCVNVQVKKPITNYPLLQVRSDLQGEKNCNWLVK